MIVLGIDPGPTHCGVAQYDTNTRRVHSAWAAMPNEDVLLMLSVDVGEPQGVAAIERMQSYGKSGASLLQTAEVSGMLRQQARVHGYRVVMLYRRDVLRALDVTGRGSHDALVRQRLIEMHGGSREVACGTKKNPGPLWGVTSHAWQALAVAVVAAQGGW